MENEKSLDDIRQNPFANLFPSPDDAERYIHFEISSNVPTSSRIVPAIDERALSADEKVICNDISNIDDLTEESKEDELLNLKIENIFLVTLNNKNLPNLERPGNCVYLEDVHKALRCHIIDLKSIEQVVFERLMLEDPIKNIICTSEKLANSKTEEAAGEKRIVFYLYACYCRLLKTNDMIEGSVHKALHSVIISQISTVLCHPEFFAGEDPHKQFLDLLLEYTLEGEQPTVSQLLVDLSFHIISNEESSGISLKDALSAPLACLQEKLSKVSLADRQLFPLLDVLEYFTKSSYLSQVLLESSTPQDPNNARAYQLCLLGLPLSISCLPRTDTDPFEFFQQPSMNSSDELSITEQNLWLPINAIVSKMYQIFYNLLKQSPEIKHLLLNWLGGCLKANNGRSKLWNTQLLDVVGSNFASDGFMLNLGAVLLMLCKPFSEPCSPKLLKVNPTYCAALSASEEDAKERNIHMKDLYSETCFMPRDENEDYSCDKTIKYNFLTECFFATHRTLLLGFHVIVNEKLLKLSQELGHMQRLYEEVRVQGAASSEVVHLIKERMEKGMTKFLSLRTALLEPETLKRMLEFHVASATWLCNISVNEELTSFKTIELPLPEYATKCLAFVPEFIMENIADCILFIKRFSPKTIQISWTLVDHLMTLIIIFMGSSERMKNPHLRARLAEVLEALMPFKEGDHNHIFLTSVLQEKTFTEHPLVIELVPTLLHVFISIEMTGENVAFEQKFQYRRPMYVVLKYLWNIEIHKQKMKSLAVEAEKNIEFCQPPLFLRFINLLINDAIFLLDEALMCMSKLRKSQQERDSGAWSSLSPRQRQQQEANFQHMGLLARFHNVMSNETIHMLQLLTSEIKSIFCHLTIMDRIAAMLNYFLLHLVGPQSKEFKVKDFHEYEFQPKKVVEDICLIYQHLGTEEHAGAEPFCLAVSRDGRSYSPKLFSQAEATLLKIGHGTLASQIAELGQTIQRIADKQQKEDEAMAEAPEEFLDPIMNTVMADPVILPSSGIRTDRATIARHLLSDQTDPFNRSYLTMDMIKPDTELKKRIDTWLIQKKQS